MHCLKQHKTQKGTERDRKRKEKDPMKKITYGTCIMTKKVYLNIEEEKSECWHHM